MRTDTSIKTYGFKDGLPLEVEVIPLSKLYTHHKNIATVPHRTRFYHVIWFQRGKATHLVDFRPIKVKANSLLFLSKDRVQSFDKSGNYDGKAILFTENFFCSTEDDRLFLRSTMLFDYLLDVPTLSLRASRTVFTTIFDAIEEELQHPVDGYQQTILKNLLHNLMLYAEREMHKQGLAEVRKGADLDYTLLFRDILDKQFKQLKSVSGYAHQIHISEKRLNKATSHILGRSPKQLIDDRVLLETKRLLVHSEHSIKEISFELGFDELTNFIKYFRKHTGITPTRFREKYLF